MGGPFLTIRKFSKDPYTVGDLIAFGTLTPQVAHFIDACVRGRLNAVISGGTGTGKTTMLNVVSSFIPNDERIVTVEDAKELRLLQEHVCSMESRPSNIEGTGEIKIRDLVRNSLRMRPDRIIIGECRGGEVLDMLQAMNTGHEGSMTTVHANTPRDALSRVEAMVGMGGVNMSEALIRQTISRSLNVIIQLSRGTDGKRRITSVAEITDIQAGVITMQEIFKFEQQGVDAAGKIVGDFRFTGIRPRALDRIERYGINPAETIKPYL
jgi:pilus assembly protein CpaF